MISSIPSIFVPLVGLIFPAIAMLSFFIYAEKESLD
uniref:Photosystem I reaction center subunit VIII n=1 Tax=Prasinoderma coloniale TaxID=156133 RepID=A0A088CI90_9VIRI|nr:subunit VIII of photosystem I [Prasinoderma coloniale]AID67525.1 subunit VIII of photosystem I [Prasinoderma coloniale]